MVYTTYYNSIQVADMLPNWNLSICYYIRQNVEDVTSVHLETKILTKLGYNPQLPLPLSFYTSPSPNMNTATTIA